MAFSLLTLAVATPVAGADPLTLIPDASTVAPLPADYRIGADGSVSVRVCYNWSCAVRERARFGAKDLAGVVARMGLCRGAGLHERLQRLRIGVWDMERLAQRSIPLLANDRAINDGEADLEGRTDCVDNSSNTTNFLSVLMALGTIPDWRVGAPRVRDRLTANVHWTATVIDVATGERWAVDSWYRPHGHLPFVSPLSAWERGETPWEPPLDGFNPYPRSIDQLCPKAKSKAG